jgi:hypothetical protein
MTLRWAVVFGTLLLVTAILWFVPSSVPARNPAVLILLGIPLSFRLVPRNWLYGMRTPRTMWSAPETWYIQNQITGIALVVAGLVWLAVVTIRTH